MWHCGLHHGQAQLATQVPHTVLHTIPSVPRACTSRHNQTTNNIALPPFHLATTGCGPSQAVHTEATDYAFTQLKLPCHFRAFSPHILHSPCSPQCLHASVYTCTPTHQCISIANQYQLKNHHVKLLTLAAESWDCAQEARLALQEHGLISI